MEKHHEYLYKQIETGYYFMCDRLPVRQDGLFKTYLWLASLAMALNVSMLQKFGSLSVWSVLSSVSLFIAFITLVMSLDSLRGRSEHVLKIPNYAEYVSYLDKPEYDTPLLARTLAADMADNLNRQVAAQSLRGERLRSMSRLLLLAFALMALASPGFILH